MKEEEKSKIIKSIKEIEDRIRNYERLSAIELIKKVRLEHPGKEQIAYVTNNIPLDMGTDEMIINTLKAEEVRLTIKINQNR